MEELLIDPILVHDYLLVMRGAERSFAAICDIWPSAPIVTLLYDKTLFGSRLTGHPIKTSQLQRLGLKQDRFKLLLPLFPLMVERLDVSGKAVVISSSSAFAHGVNPDDGAVHVCYCYTPFRYAWFENDYGLAQAPRIARPALRRVLAEIRVWDAKKAARNTHYIAVSRMSQERIASFWNVHAPIVYPPVELSRFAPGEPEDFLLVVCELVRHKRVDIALEAARRARIPIKVVGTGPDESRLRALYAETAQFLGRLTDAELAQLYPRALALVVPNVEEFGIAAVEAQASGIPVIAARGGGALETVIDGETGLFFDPGQINDLVEMMTEITRVRFRSQSCAKSAQRFSVPAFRDAFREQVRSALASQSGKSVPGDNLSRC